MRQPGSLEGSRSGRECAALRLRSEEQASSTLRLRGGRFVLWLVHAAAVRVVHSAVLGEESVRGSCDRTQLTSASARACGLWCLIGCLSVGSVVLAAEVSSACAQRKVRFGFGELVSSVGRWCLRCAGAVGWKACKAGLRRNQVLCWECVGEAWSSNIISSSSPLGRAHSSNRLVEVRRSRGGCRLEAFCLSLLRQVRNLDRHW